MHEREFAASEKHQRPRREVYIYANFVVLWVLYCPIWKVWEASSRSPGNIFSLRRDGKLQAGWPILNAQYQDVSCVLWRVWRWFIISKWLPFGGVYILIGKVVWKGSKYNNVLNIIYSSISLGVIFGWWFLCLILAFNILGFGVSRFQRPWMVWFFTVIEMAIVSHTSVLQHWLELFSYSSLTTVCLGCHSLRLLSFGLEYCKRANQTEKSGLGLSFSLTDLLAYNFFFPLLVYGPLITYDQFWKPVRKRRDDDLLHQTAQALPKLLLCLLLALLVEISTHSFYFHGLAKSASILKTLDSPTVMGILFWCVFLQYLLYYILYELSAAAASFDDITIPTPPACVFSYFTFREYWKCIYGPLVKKHQSLLVKSLGVLCCFLFVAAWHGGGTEHLAWAVLSWGAIQAEVLALVLLGTKPVRSSKFFFCPGLLMRLQSIAWCPVYLLLLCAHTLLIIGRSTWDIVPIIWYKSDFVTLAAAGMFLYSIIQICTLRREERREENIEKPSSE